MARIATLLAHNILDMFLIGYKNSRDLMNSLIKVENIPNLILAGGFLTFVEAFIAQSLGVSGMAYLAFVVCILLEFALGLSVALKMRKRFEPNKLFRVVVKIVVYSTALWVIQMQVVNFAHSAVQETMWKFLHSFIYNVILVQLIISILENLGELGVREVSVIIDKLYEYLNKWFDIKKEQVKRKSAYEVIRTSPDFEMIWDCKTMQILVASNAMVELGMKEGAYLKDGDWKEYYAGGDVSEVEMEFKRLSQGIVSTPMRCNWKYGDSTIEIEWRSRKENGYISTKGKQIN